MQSLIPTIWSLSGYFRMCLSSEASSAKRCLTIPIRSFTSFCVRSLKMILTLRFKAGTEMLPANVMVELRDCVQKLIGQQMDGYIPDTAIQQTQAELNELYDSFTEKYGLINSRGNALAFADDSSYYLLCSLEMLDEDNNLSRKADMFTKRTIKPHGGQGR